LFTVSLRRRRSRRALAFALVALVTAGTAFPAGAQTDATSGDTLRDKLQEQQELKAKQQRQAAQLNVLEAREDQVSGAIDVLQSGVQNQQSKLVQAQLRAVEADAALTAARAEEAAQLQRLAATEAEAVQFALQAYVSPTNERAAMFAPDADSVGFRAGLASLQASRFGDTLDQLDAVRADVQTARANAEQASVRADQRKADASLQLQQLEQSLGQQQQLDVQIEARLDEELIEAAVLDQLDSKLAGEIRAEQEAIAARLAAARQAAEAAAARNGLSLSAAGGGGGGGGGAGRSVGSPVGTISVTTVGGITVASHIAGQISALLQDAAAAGIVLGGGGYRSSDAQIAVRRSNCGPSQYDIWQKPSSQCRPPAARPGQSMHERGEAIDFTCNGALISSRSNACYRWLAANAGRYGLQGNSREAWHWSTNGR
jgi:peptidoglycan hydrolase CwlO-like protein